MRNIIPDNIKKEQDKLFELYMKSDEEIGLRNFMYKNGSKALKRYITERERQLAENEKKGIVVN